jgi:AAA+ superfamily predicted ATPase
MMIAVMLIPLVLAFLPIEDANIKITLAAVIGEILSNGNVTKWFSYYINRLKKKRITIPNKLADESDNPLYHKTVEYLINKYPDKLTDCELIPKNGDINYNLSNMDGMFVDMYELDGIKYKFYLMFTPGDKGSSKIQVSCNTATPDIIKKYIRSINLDYKPNGNIITVFNSVIRGKKKEEQFVEWGYVTVKTNKTLNNTIYDDEIKTGLFDDIDNFMSNEKWYMERGIPYKRGYFLYSTPGQGKTSVAKIIANKYDIPIFCLDLTTVKENSDLTKLITSINYHINNNERYILLIEDIDNHEFIKGGNNGVYYYDAPKKEHISMDCFLNVLDGVTEPHGRIVIMTANQSDAIISNRALLRPGRIDKVIEFKECNKQQIRRMYSMFYNNDLDWDNINVVENLSAATIVKLLQENIDRPENFIQVITNPDDCKVDDVSNTNQGTHSRMSRHRKPVTLKQKIRRCEKYIDENDMCKEKTARKLEKLQRKMQEKQKAEQERINRKKAKAKAKKTLQSKLAKIRSSVNDTDVTDVTDDMNEFETPAFLLNSIEADELSDDCVTTYTDIVDETENYFNLF